MIHLDTNYVIGLVTGASPLRAHFTAWFAAEEKFAISAIAWSEFLNGPVTGQEVRDAKEVLEGRIISFGISEAELAAKLFNEGGRKRGTQPDCFIAATAICAKAHLATQNKRDFLRFRLNGLQLA